MRKPKQRQTKPRQSKQRKPNDLSRSLAALDLDCTLIAVIEMGASSWLVAGLVPGVERQPLKKLKTDEYALLALLERWRGEAVRSGYAITRIVVAYEAGRDGFWLARWLRAQGIEAHVIHAASVAVSREHRRAKTDRLDTELLKRYSVGTRFWPAVPVIFGMPVSMKCGLLRNSRMQSGSTNSGRTICNSVVPLPMPPIKFRRTVDFPFSKHGVILARPTSPSESACSPS